MYDKNERVSRLTKKEQLLRVPPASEAGFPGTIFKQFTTNLNSKNALSKVVIVETLVDVEPLCDCARFVFAFKKN